MEDVVPEELDGVPLARLGPLLAVFGPFGDEVELGHEAHDAGVFELTVQVGGQLVVGVEGGVEGAHEVRVEADDEFVDAGGLGGVGHAEELEEALFELGRVGAREVLGGFGEVVRGGWVVGAEGEYQVAEVEKVFALEID